MFVHKSVGNKLEVTQIVSRDWGTDHARINNLFVIPVSLSKLEKMEKENIFLYSCMMRAKLIVSDPVI